MYVHSVKNALLVAPPTRELASTKCERAAYSPLPLLPLTLTPAPCTFQVQLGIYTSHGNLTCEKYPGSYGHEAQDAKAFASWNVAFVKNDWCSNRKGYPQVPDLEAFDALRDALNSTGRPITYSVHWNYDNTKAPSCATGVSCPLPSVANMWRIGNDIQCDWEKSVLRLIDVDTPLAANAGPGRWNDADMLQVGNGMTEDQDRAHFTMWSMLASPLIAGNDLTTMSNATRSILTNKHAIAVNQDPLGVQATLVNGTGPVDGYSARIREASAGTLSTSIPSGASDTQVWAKALAATDSFAVAFLHRNATAGADASITLDFHALCRPGLCRPGQNPPMSYEVYDLWADGVSLGVHTGSLSFRVKPSSARMVKLVARARALDSKAPSDSFH